MSHADTAKLRLLVCARQEFLQHGYAKSSLRRICQSAGVTTGALYFFFPGKEALFAAVVDDTARELLQLFRQQTAAEVDGVGSSEAAQRTLIRFLFTHRDEVRILLRGAEGTAYEPFYQQCSDLIARGFCLYYDKCGGPAEYRDVMKLLASARVQGYMELLESNADLDTLMRYAALMECYGDHGFAGMMKDFNRIVGSSAE